MKKRFLSKSLIAKIALVLVIILVFEFSASEPVHAASLGGTLLNPIVNLVVYLSDGVIQILQSALTSIENSFTYIDITKSKPSFWIAVVTIIVGVLAVVWAVAAVVLVTVVTGGAAVPAIVVSVATGIAGTGLTAATAGTVYLAVYPRFGSKIDAVVFGNSFVYSTIFITPETILKNQIKLFDVNYFSKVKDDSQNIDKTESLSQTLRNVISQVYITVRDIALVAMLIVIIYIAIRMLLALTPKEKSRYKESAVNCVIGLVLIIIMHFIMSISVTALEMITNSIVFTNQVYDIAPDRLDEKGEIESFLASNQDAYDNAISGVMLEIAGAELFDKVIDPNADDSDPEPPSIYNGMALVRSGEEKITYVKASNFTEQARYMAQKLYVLDGDNNTVETWEHIGWAFVYIMLVVLTLAFVLMYAKRTLYMAALTMFAPIVGVMYPINRANGGRAHTLNLWFREYMGNLIIQPFHLLLYTIFIGSAMSMAIHNPVYVIIAIMGLIFVEKLLKDLLGIQDTRIGGLGKSLQDTTRAIKTTEKAATSIARTVGRTVSRGTHAIGAGAVGLAGLAAAKATPSEEEKFEGRNNTLRVQQNTSNSGSGGGELPPTPTPPTAGAQNLPNADDSLDNAGQNRQNEQLEQTENQRRRVALLDKKKQLEESINGEDNEWVAQGYRQELDDVNWQLAQLDKEEQREALVNEKTRLQEAINGEDNEWIAQGYRQELDNVNWQLASMGYGEGNSQINTIGGESLDQDTLSMVDSLNDVRTPFEVIEGTSENVIGTDGYRNILRDDNGNLRIETRNTSDGRDPMAMAMAAGAETSSSMATNRTENLRSVGDIETALETGRSNASSSHSSSNSGFTSYGTSDIAQSIPDGNNSNVSETTSRIREGWTVVDGGRTNSGTDNNTTNTVQNDIENNVEVNDTHQEANPTPSNTRTNAGTNNNAPQNDNGTPVGVSGARPRANPTSSNSATNTGKKETSNKPSTAEKIARGVETGMNVAGTVGGRAAGVVGTAVEGVIGAALAGVEGNPGGVIGTVVGTGMDAINIIEGGAGKSSSSRRSSSPSSTPTPKQEKVSQDADAIMKETGMTPSEAEAFANKCKENGIADNRNMAQVGIVYKKASTSEKPYIVELSKILYESKRNGKSFNDAKGVLERAGMKSSTMDAFKKMYDKLIT